MKIFKLILLFIFLISVISNYFFYYPLPFVKYLPSILLLLFILLLSNALGKKAMRYLKIESGNLLEKTVFSVSMGLGCLSLSVFFVGIIGLLNIIVIIILLSVLFMFCYPEIKISVIEFRESITRLLNADMKISDLLFIIPVSAAIILGFIVSLAPPTFYDSLVYHLAVPEAYVIHRKIYPLPSNFYSNFPQNMEMLYTLALLFKTDILANLFSFSFGILNLLAIIGFSLRFIDKATSRWAAMLFIVTPAVILLSSGNYVEMGLSLYSLLSLYAIICWYNPEPKTRETGWLIIAGIFSGLAFGVKYTAGLEIVILGLFLITQSKKSVLIYSLAAFAVSLPWLIKNLLFIGNPVFPFLYQLSIGKASPWSKETAAEYFRILTVYSPRKAILRDLIQFPWNISNEPIRFGGGFDVLGNLGWPIYFFLLPVLLFINKINRTIKLLLVFSGIYFLAWFTNREVLRFLMPLLPVLAIIIGYGMANFYKHLPWVNRSFGLIIITPFIISNLYLFSNVESIIQPFGVAMGIEPRDEYLERQLPYYPVFSYINSNLPESAKILFWGEQRSYYCHRDLIATTVGGPNLYPEYANEAANSETLMQQLKKSGITHIFYNQPEANRLQTQYQVFKFTEHGLQNHQEFQNRYLKEIYSKNRCYLYAIL